ncbi:MAG: hypothetical protein GY940_47705 [bacterium]|nr:hypothetical protein [bacterium]
MQKAYQNVTLFGKRDIYSFIAGDSGELQNLIVSLRDTFSRRPLAPDDGKKYINAYI